MVLENLLRREKEKNIVDSMLLAVCWNVDSVAQAFPDEDGNKDPYKITFIYKTGFRNEVRNAKERFDNAKSVGDKAKELCSYVSDNTY